MSPTSGARSGTPPGRGKRGGGDGRVMVGHLLECGHVSYAADPVSSTNKTKWYRCTEGCGLQKQKGR